MGGRGTGTGGITAEDAVRWIVGYFADNGYWPTFRELAAGLRLGGPSGAQYIIGKLGKLGLVSAGIGESATARVMVVKGLSPLLRETAANWLKAFKLNTGEVDGSHT